MARLCVGDRVFHVGDRIFHVQFPMGGEQTGSYVVLCITENDQEDGEGDVIELRPVGGGVAFTCFHRTHRYSEEEGARLLLAGVRHGNDMRALFGNDRENYPYLEKGERNGKKRGQRHPRKNVGPV